MEENTALEEILNGSFVFRRFTRKEQGGSSDAADRFLWLALLRAELELGDSVGRGMCPWSEGADVRKIAPFRFLDSLAQELPGTFRDVQRQTGQFRDRGQESVVFDGGDGFVYKLRKMRPSVLSGYIAPLANIVYHNALFPNDRYVLETIYRGAGDYFMVLRQPRVEIALMESGYPVRPTADQIREAVASLHNGLIEYERDEDEDGIGGESSTESDEESGVHLKFYNSDYYVSDFQPGRNTIIDAETGAVRFIDPRIALNDPDGPLTPVSRIGRRHERVPPMPFP